MGGDHKCSVCQATFTRPQHVARHMRSHTGDRPYKCQHCLDQFARSDLLSRHVSKCHANEKPLPGVGTSRRKGSASSWRATTSKQACDQCVQSSLPCDGSNPCAKCVQRKTRCTFVKFHRQTAPIGPGHNPRPTPGGGPPSPHNTGPSISSSRIGGYPGPSDEYLMSSASNPVTTMGEALYASSSFAFPPLYPQQQPSQPDPAVLANDPEFAARLRARADILARSGTMMPGVQPVYAGSPVDMRPGSSSSTSSMAHSWTSYDDVSERSMHPDYSRQMPNGSGVGVQMSQDSAYNSPTIPQGTFSFQVPRDRRGSLDMGSDGSTTSYSVPSSATSSTLHLPLESGAHQMQRPQSHPLQVQHNAHPHAQVNAMTYNNMTVDHPHILGRERVQIQDQDQGVQVFRTDVQDIAQASKRETSGGAMNPNAIVGSDGIFSSAFGLMTLDDPNMLVGLIGDHFPPFAYGMHDDPNATPMPQPGPRSSTHRNTISSPNAAGLWAGSSSQSKEADARELKEFWRQYMSTPLTGPTLSPLLRDVKPQDTSYIGSQSSTEYRRPRGNSLPPGKTPMAEVDRQVHCPVAVPASHLHGADDKSRVTSHVRTTLAANAEDLRSYEQAVRSRQMPTNLSLGPKAKARARNASSTSLSPQISMSSLSPDTPARIKSSASSSSLANAFGPDSLRQSSQSPRSCEGSTESSGSDEGLYRPSFKRLSSHNLEADYSKRTALDVGGAVVGVGHASGAYSKAETNGGGSQGMKSSRNAVPVKQEPEYGVVKGLLSLGHSSESSKKPGSQSPFALVGRIADRRKMSGSGSK